MSFLKYRDSLSGQMNETFAIKEFYRLCKKKNFGAVMVRIEGCENLPFYKAEICIRQTGQLLANITKCDAARIKNGEFIFFTQNCEKEAEKVEFFLSKFSDEVVRYAIGAKCFEAEISEYSDFIEALNQVAFMSRYEKDEKGIY